VFTGIIRKLTNVEKVFEQNKSLFVEIRKAPGWKYAEGDSISVNGVCSTINKVSSNAFVVEYMPETVKKTTAGNYQKDTPVNLEKSLTLNDLLDGHLVMGHVDTTGRIIEIKKVKQSKVMKIKIPKRFIKFVAPKGSVAIDGISLTVVDSEEDWFTVSLVSYTLDNTNLGMISEGAEVNIELDIIAKYVEKLLASRGI
jgi:riboflavin synthase